MAAIIGNAVYNTVKGVKGTKIINALKDACRSG